MTREEAIEALRAKINYYENDKRLKAALETLIPELAESEDGTYFARIVDWKITDDPMPSRPEGETVKPGDDSQNMAPARVRDPRDTSKYKTKRHEEEAVKNGVTVEQARRIIRVGDFSDEELCDELRNRGYHGTITRTKTITI